MKKIVVDVIILLIFLSLSFTTIYANNRLTDDVFIKVCEGKNYQEIIALVNGDIRLAKLYCNQFFEYKHDDKQFGQIEFWQSFKMFCDNKKGDCEDYANAIVAMVGDTYPIKFLEMEYNRDNATHLVFLYKKDGKYGAEANDSAEPNYKTIEAMVKDNWPICIRYAVYNMPANYLNLIRTSSNCLNSTLIKFRQPFKDVNFTMIEELQLFLFNSCKTKFSFHKKIHINTVLLIAILLSIVIFLGLFCFKLSFNNFVMCFCYSLIFAPFIMNYESLFCPRLFYLLYNITSMSWIITAIVIFWIIQFIKYLCQSIYFEKTENIRIKFQEMDTKIKDLEEVCTYLGGKIDHQ